LRILRNRLIFIKYERIKIQKMSATKETLPVARDDTRKFQGRGDAEEQTSREAGGDGGRAGRGKRTRTTKAKMAIEAI
jgi:hypothetical protein